MLYLIIGTIFNIFAECYKFVNYIRYFFTDYEYEIKEYSSERNENKLRVLNWNIHYGKSLFERDNLIKMCDLINKLNIDICVFQEVTSNKKADQIQILKKCCGFAHHFYSQDTVLFDYKRGNLILSKYEFIEKKKYRFKRYYFRPNNNAISVKIKFKNQYLWISNLHLSCDVTGYQQNHQVTEFLEKINLNERNLVCGDLNSLESYSCITKLKNNFKIGLVSKTFPSLYPLYQIDHVLYNDISDITCHTLDSTLSDHLPILIEIV